MGTEAGRFRHRVDIEYPIESQDGTGQPVKSWLPFALGVPAEIAAVSAREFIAGGSEQAKIVARIRIRFRPGIDATMRCKHKVAEDSSGPVYDIYNIEGALPDPDSGRCFILLPVSKGTNEG